MAQQYHSWRLTNVSDNLRLPTVNESAPWTPGICHACHQLNLGIAYFCTQAGSTRLELGQGLDESEHPAFRSLIALRDSARHCECCQFLFDAFHRDIFEDSDVVAAAASDHALLWSHRVCELIVKNRPGWGMSEVKFELQAVEPRDGRALEPRLLEFDICLEESSQIDPLLQAALSIDAQWVETDQPAGAERIPFQQWTMEISILADREHVSFEEAALRWNKLLRRVRTPLSKPTASEVAHTISDWLAQCDGAHAECSTLRETGRASDLPDRVLFVGTTEEPCLRLVDNTTQLEDPGRYVALSYCWGSDHTFKTTKENLMDHFHSMDEIHLPQTYTDVIAITRALRIQYLWIDAFCILQGDFDDWDQQSGKMDVIYGSSYLTICASRARGISEGFLGERRGGVHARCGSFRFADKDYVAHLSHKQNDPFQGKLLSNQILATRGWAYQERILPRRKVFFTSREMLWDCQRIHGSESWPPRFDVDLWRKFGDDAKPVPWESIVDHFSSCLLTRASDRLPALAGAAKQYAFVTGDEYAAGLWRGSLPQCLLWRMIPSYRTYSRADSVLCAPSWSWGSVEGVVEFLFGWPREMRGGLIEVLQISTTARGSNRFGEITGGWMDVRGPCAPIRFQAGFEATIRWSGHEYKFALNTTKRSRGKKEGLWWDEHPEKDKNKMYVLLLGFEGSYEQGASVDAYHGLLLQRIEGNEARTFQRAGVFINYAIEAGLNVSSLQQEIRIV